MDSIEFERKLKRLNNRLYLGKNIIDTFNPELLSTGIYYKELKTDPGFNLNDLSGKDYSNARKQFVENPDIYLTWCTIKHIPEGNWYNEKGKLIAKGWREILKFLSEKGYFDLKRAAKVFNCSSLGYSNYDSLNHDQKFQKFFKKPDPISLMR